MRLLHCHTLELKEFVGVIPPYFILSHRWGEDEVSYKDFRKGRSKDGAGYQKILDFCTLVRERSPELTLDHTAVSWVWVDTWYVSLIWLNVLASCIDKRSSAELSEAINSMWDWYKNAKACIAYLQDVCPSASQQHEETMSSFRDSVWFTRGWTLQELLAPGLVIFCTKLWNVLGTKCQHSEYVRGPDSRGMHVVVSIPSLQTEISAVTGIQEIYLLNSSLINLTSIACRMSWAARRLTTRDEDTAYCLLGLFGVNMPLLYGEGKRAFRRLQEELIRRTTDESIFAWRFRNDATSEEGRETGMLAAGPKAYEDCGNIHRTLAIMDASYALSNKGIEMHCKAFRLKMPEGQYEEIKWSSLEGYVIPLNCGELVECRSLRNGSEIIEEDACNLCLGSEPWSSELVLPSAMPTMHFVRAVLLIGQSMEDPMPRYTKSLAALSVQALHLEMFRGALMECEPMTYIIAP